MEKKIRNSCFSLVLLVLAGCDVEVSRVPNGEPIKYESGYYSCTYTTVGIRYNSTNSQIETYPDTHYGTRFEKRKLTPVTVTRQSGKKEGDIDVEIVETGDCQ